MVRTLPAERRSRMGSGTGKITQLPVAFSAWPMTCFDRQLVRARRNRLAWRWLGALRSTHSKRMRPGLDHATQNSGFALPEPIRVSAGRHG